MKEKKFTMVDLFCGAGIGALGFKKAGFEIVWAIDNNKYAVQTYNQNIGKHAILSDIRKIDFDLIPDSDVISGGFPCQPFSLGGKGDGERCSKKGDLGEYFLNIIKYKKPKAFLMENVGGIVSKRHNAFFNNLMKNFKSSGYKVEWKLINCWDYGVPQLRKRVFVVGIRKDINKNFTFPSFIQKEEKKNLKDAIYDLPEAIEYDISKIENCNFKNHYYKEEGYSSNYLSRNRQKQWDEPSFTIVSSCRHLPLYPEPANYDIRKMNEYDCKPPRRFTVRECLRLQTVPDSFYFEDSVPIKKQYERCSGIPSLVAEKLSESIIDSLS